MKRLICFMMVISMILSVGCVEKNIKTVTSDKAKDSIVYGVEKMPMDLSQFNNNEPEAQCLIANVFQGLITTDENGNIVPGIAESWSIDKLGLTYKFKIRENALWSNGSRITAFDFSIFFSQILNNKVDNIYANPLNCIRNVDNYKKGLVNFQETGIKALSEDTLEISLSNPCSYLLNVLSEPIFGIRKVDSKLFNYTSNYKDIIYSGAYTIYSIEQNGNIILCRNNNYYDSKKVNDNKIEITISGSSESSLADYENGNIDIYCNPPRVMTESLLSENKAEKFKLKSEEGIVFNVKSKNGVQEKDFRKAISLVIDRNKISQEVMGDYAIKAVSFIPEENAESKLNQDVEKEKALNLLGKIKINKENNTLKLVYLNSVENKKIADYISKALKENLRVEVKPIGLGKKELDETIKRKEYDMALIEQSEDYDNPVSLLEKWMSASNLNTFGYKNYQFDSNIIKSRIEPDVKKSRELLNQSENIILEDVIFIPLYLKNIIVCKATTISGIYITFNGCIKFDKLNKRSR